MKHPVVAWRVALAESDLDSTAKLVGLVVSLWMNLDGECFPSRASIAKRCSLSDRAVDAALVRVENAGFLEVERSRGGYPKSSSNFYTATLPSSEGRSPLWLESSEPPSPKQRTSRQSSSEPPSPEVVKGLRGRGRADVVAPDGAPSPAAPFVPFDVCAGCEDKRELVVAGTYCSPGCQLDALESARSWQKDLKTSREGAR